MRAIVFDRFGAPAEVLQLRDTPPPQPGPGQVLVRMLASPINPSDLMMIRGVYGMLPTLPATPGFEGVGRVEAAGSGLLGKFLVGKRVSVLNSVTGSWRDQTIVSARQAIPLSNGIPTDQAAMFFVNPATAYIMTRQALNVPRGEWLLQTAAGSALGRMVIRLGRLYGFKTLNVVRRPEQAQELLRLGGDAAIAVAPEQLPEEVRKITGGDGVRYAIDPVGGELGSAVVRCLGLGGRMLVYGTLSGEPLVFSPRELMTPATSIQGFWLGRWMTNLGLLGKLRLVRKVGKLIKAGVLVSEVGQSFPLERIGEAVTAAEETGHSGKVLLRIGNGEKPSR